MQGRYIWCSVPVSQDEQANQQNPQRKHEQAPIEIGTSNQDYDREDVPPDREPTGRQTCVDGNGRRRDHEDRRRLYQVNVDHPVGQAASEMKSSGGIRIADRTVEATLVRGQPMEMRITDVTRKLTAGATGQVSL